MQIPVNGEPRPPDAGASVAALVRLFNLAPQRVAIEVNAQLVRRATYADTPLQENDRVELVTIVAGG